MTLIELPKVKNPFIRGWQGEPEDGDTRFLSASTIAGRVPDFYRKRWHLGNMLQGLAANPELARHVLEVAGKYPDLAADYVLPFEYGPENEDGFTPAERGTDAHDLVEQYYRTRGSLDDLAAAAGYNEMTLAITENLIDALTTYGITPKYMEEFIYNPDTKRGGRVDCLGEHESPLHVVDFKTMAKKPNRYYASKHYVQLGTYTRCTRIATYDPVRTWGKGGRQYLMNEAEAEWYAELPPISTDVYVVIGWPEGWQVRRVTIDDETPIDASARMYHFVEDEARKKNKLVAKGGNA